MYNTRERFSFKKKNLFALSSAFSGIISFGVVKPFGGANTLLRGGV